MPDATETICSAAGDPAKPSIYDAFLSHTHRDRPVAGGIQKGLHRIGRRPGQLRALRVFRDDTNLEVSPDLWGKFIEALDRSRFLIVVLSPMAAESYWVNREVNYWLEHGGRDRLLIVLAARQLLWDDEQARFDPQTSDAALPVLTEPGVLSGRAVLHGRGRGETLGGHGDQQRDRHDWSGASEQGQAGSPCCRVRRGATPRTVRTSTSRAYAAEQQACSQASSSTPGLFKHTALMTRIRQATPRQQRRCCRPKSTTRRSAAADRGVGSASLDA